MQVKICDIVNLSKGKQINGTNLLEDGEFGYLNGGINYSGRWNNYNVDENSITISEGGNSSGYVKYNKEKIWCGAHCYYLYNLKCDNKYLFYNLKYNENKIMNLRTGACMPNLKKNDLLNFKISYESDSNKQKYIVNVLDNIEYLINNRISQINCIEKIKKSRYSIIYEKCKTFEKIGDHTKIKARIGWQGLTKKEYLNYGNYYLITGTDFNNIRIDFEKCHYVTKERYDQDTNIQVHKDDVLITKDGTIGKVAYISKEPIKPTTLNSGVFLVRANKNINPIFLTYTLLSEQFKNYIENSKTGATISHLNQGIFIKYNMPIPEMSDQLEFEILIKTLDKQIALLQNDIIVLNKLKQSKMQEYFI